MKENKGLGLTLSVLRQLAERVLEATYSYLSMSTSVILSNVDNF